MPTLLLTLSPPVPLDPSLVAFLRSHSRAWEQTGTEASKEQSPETPSVPVTKEEPITSTTSEPSKEDKLEPGAPGLEERCIFWWVGVEREEIASCGAAAL